MTAADGLEALQIFQADALSFSLILMGMCHVTGRPLGTELKLTVSSDLSMPVMDGLTSSRHIRTYELQNSLPRIHIVALTCFSSPEYQRDAARSGVDLFLIKPVPMKTLKPILDLDPGSFPEG